ncbi:MAG: MupG family TIM beta-alpha barrel fold protein [Negativicutes bacterium]|jgi:hypothetical protein
MFKKGISAYVGMEHSLADNIAYLHMASKYGYSLLFTSLHVPEASAEDILRDFGEFTRSAKAIGYRIIADISPSAFKMLGASMADLEPLRAFSVDVWRFDFGFSFKEIACFSENGQFNIQINASTIDKRALKQLLRTRIRAHNIESCHNFYPREETGLSFELFCKRSVEFRKQGIPVYAFVPSRDNPRGPIYAGLPTLEQHREISSLIAAKHLLATGLCNGVIFGDSFVPEAELKAVGELSNDCVQLKCKFAANASPIERSIVLAPKHTNRTDPGRYCLRSEESRGLYNLENDRQVIEPNNTGKRLHGSITLDNSGYGRYMGELQLITHEMAADQRVNVVAQVVDEELFLVDMIKPGQAFAFVEIGN